MAAPGGPAIDPIHQFQINQIIPIHIGKYDLSFTNSSLYMMVAVAAVAIVMIYGMRPGALVPGRLQSLAETTYEFVGDMLRSAAGSHGMQFFPLVFTLFMFVLICNLIGLIPYAFTVTSHIIITAALALTVFLTVVVAGIAKHGLRFFKLFVPAGVPVFMLPLVVLIEIVSFLSRPLSHSVRLFANMLAGHITLKVFGGFVVGLLGAGGWALLSPLPLAMAIGLTALELLVAFVQAYVFAMLTCMYLNDALHPGH